MWEGIPESADILMTHGPPIGKDRKLLFEIGSESSETS